MAALPEDEAIRRGARELGVDAQSVRRVWPVAWIDRPEDSAYLAEFEDAQGLVIALLDAATGVPKQTARLPAGGTSTIAVDEGEARRRAGAGAEASARLVWKPCQASRSPLYPIWEIRDGERVAYVDQRGRVWSELAVAGPG